MNIARRRGQTFFGRSVPSSTTKVKSKSTTVTPKKDCEISKMEEEPVSSHKKHIKKHNVDEDEIEDSTSDEIMDMEPEKEREQLKMEIAPQTVSKMRPTEDLYLAIRDRYSELLRELYQTEKAANNAKFTDTQKEILRKRIRLWLEYFITTATFRDENVNLFDYMDSFLKGQEFI